MNLNNLIREIDAEIARLHTVKQLLSESMGVARRVGRPRTKGTPSRPTRKVMSAEARAKIAAAQRARWAKAAKGSKKTAQSRVS